MRPARLVLSGLLLLSLVPLLGGCGVAPPPITGRVEQEDLPSTIVGDSFRIQVRLPPSYDADSARRFPVVYQLDGTSFGPQFEIAAGHASDLAAKGTIPEVIVVGVGYPYDDPLLGGKQGRSRDYVSVFDNGKPGGLGNFLRFLREELLPRIDGKYRTDPAARALSGHSLGGFVSLYALFTTGTEAAPPFSRFVACDPGTPFKDPDRTLLEEKALAAATRSLPRRLHFQIARYDGAIQQLWYQELSERLRANYPDLKLTTEMSDTDHGGVISPCIASGLTSVFGGGQS